MIIYKSEKEIELMKKSSQIVARILSELRELVKPGIETRELDFYAEKRTIELGARPAFKGYNGYPASLCVSVNEEIVHGIPSDRKLKEGDIVSLDFGVIYDGYYGDAAITVPVGQVSDLARKLIAVAESSFYRGMEQMKEGNRLSDISAAVQAEVERAGFSVIRAFVGHGIGQKLHEEPQVPNFGLPGHGPKLRRGLVLAIEPMIAAGKWEVEILDDGWTAVTKDRSLAAHFEHTVALTGEGPVILSVDNQPTGIPESGGPANA
ncbi:MAG: type I methionyl aminopeptidase [Candidatus Saccharicenans sp.]|nr:MAG: type I methionyl aminopeptidase [Candidatus Aminicenantes bacterium]HEK86463.1 type I methionyl aminopeptidase [Candidatus Aminicenantes bacterium]